MILGVLTEVLLAAAVVGIAVLLYPYLKRQHEGLALGYVGARTLEAAVILVGGISSLLMLSLSERYIEAGEPGTGGYQAVGDVLVATREWTDALGPALLFGVTALILYTLLYQSRLVPRWLSAWGLVGGVLIVVAGILGMFGWSPTSTLSIVLTAPIGVNELVLAVWLMVKGFDEPEATLTSTPRGTPIPTPAKAST